MFTKWLAVTALCCLLSGGAMGQMSSSNGKDMVTGHNLTDATAMRAFLTSAYALISNPTPGHDDFSNLMRMSNISKPGIAALRGIVEQWHQKQIDLDTAHDKLSSPTYAQQEAYINASYKLAKSVLTDDVPAMLGADDAEQFDAYIQGYKLHTRADKAANRP